MGVFGKKSTPAGTTAEDADFASKAASMREAQDAQQLKTFTRWWNSVLKPRGVKIEDLVVEVSPGVNPIMLYEELSGTLVKKYSKKPPSRFQKLENQNIFLKALKEKGIRLVNIGAEDLVDSNRTLICGLTWTLILRYEIQKYGANESELLRWVAGRRRTRRRRVQRGCREGGVAWWEEERSVTRPLSASPQVKACTAGYKGVNITTWGDSFNDGRARGTRAAAAPSSSASPRLALPVWPARMPCVATLRRVSLGGAPSDLPTKRHVTGSPSAR